MKRTAITVVAACGTAIAATAFLIRHPPANEVLAAALGLAAIVVPVAAAVWLLSDRPPRPNVAQSPWLDVSVDEDHVTVFGDEAALEALGTECLRLARASSAGEVAAFEAHGAGTVTIERIEPPPPRPRTWRERLAPVGCMLLLLVLAAVWLRGCVAFEHDVRSWRTSIDAKSRAT